MQMLPFLGSNEALKELFKRRILDIGGDVNKAMYEYVREMTQRFIALGSPDITVFISSGGGSCKFGLDIYDLFVSYPGAITGQVYSYANSMATVILQACDLRQCAKHADILIHNPNRECVPWEEFKSDRKRKKSEKKLDLSRTRIIDIYCLKTGRSRKEIAAQMKKDEKMTAEEALKFGLIDEIIKPGKKTKRMSEEATSGN